MLIWNQKPRTDFQSRRFCNRFLTSVGLEITDNYINTLCLKGVRLFQHLVRLADAGCIAHKHL